jgi:hypothetical protein
VPIPSVELLELPNRFDRRILEEEYDRIPRFLQSVQRVRELELANGNGAFFHILAEQWKILASLQYVFQQSPATVLASVERWLDHVVLGMELSHGVEVGVMLEYFFGAIAVKNDSCAHCLATAPADLLGFADDPDSLWPIVGRVAFAFLREEDDEARTFLELLHGHLFEAPPDAPSPPGKAELCNLQRLGAALLARNAAVFNEQLEERCRLRVAALEVDADLETPQVIDWIALGLSSFARDRGLTPGTRHPYVPLILCERRPS